MVLATLQVDRAATQKPRTHIWRVIYNGCSTSESINNTPARHYWPNRPPFWNTLPKPRKRPPAPNWPELLELPCAGPCASAWPDVRRTFWKKGPWPNPSISPTSPTTYRSQPPAPLRIQFSLTTSLRIQFSNVPCTLSPSLLVIPMAKPQTNGLDVVFTMISATQAYKKTKIAYHAIVCCIGFYIGFYKFERN